MAVAALTSWLITAAGGPALLGTWLVRGGAHQHRQGHSRLGPRVLFSHAGLAAIGLVVWIVAFFGDLDGLRWLSLALLPVVAALGLTMFLKWLGGRGAHAGLREIDAPAEQHFPVAIVFLHGLFAVVTVLLVVLAAIGVGT